MRIDPALRAGFEGLFDDDRHGVSRGVAAAVYALVRDGRIDLDAPVARHVDFTRDAATRAITPRHLLSHAGGLPNWRTDAGSDLVSRFAPGSAFRYSGEGFVLLGRLVEAVTGRTAAEVVRDRVLVPAGMARSRYGWTAEQTPAVAWAHDADGELLPEAGPAHFEAQRAAGPRRPVETWTRGDQIAAASALGKPPLPLFMMPKWQRDCGRRRAIMRASCTSRRPIRRWTCQR